MAVSVLFIVSRICFRLLQQTSDDLADWYFRNGLPAMAACCHLAVNDCQVRF